MFVGDRVVVTQVKPVWSVGTEKLFIAGNTSEIKILKNTHRNSRTTAKVSTVAKATVSNKTLRSSQSRGGMEDSRRIQSDISAVFHHSVPSAVGQLLDAAVTLWTLVGGIELTSPWL